MDVRYALRRLQRSPLFTAVAAVSLAIAIGATTATFSLGNALLLRPIAGLYRQQQLVDIGRTQGGKGFDTASYPNYLDIRQRSQTLDGIYAYEIEPTPMGLGTGDTAERVYGTVVSGNYFEVLGVRPLLGRLLQDMDDRQGKAPVAVISDQLWRQRFASDSEIAGKIVKINGSVVTLVGVAPEGFTGTTVLRQDVWMPISALATAMPRRSAKMLDDRQGAWLVMGGRLKQGVSLGQVNAELGILGSNLEREYPDANRGRSYRAVNLSQYPGRADIVAGFVLLLMAIVGLILVIACANLVSMMLARAAAREHEIAVRLAVGASRARLIRELLTETMLLFLLGGAIGLLFSRWFLRGFLAFVPQLPFPLAIEPTMDWRVILFSAGVTAISGVLAGLAPAMYASSPALMGMLRTVDSAGPGKTHLRDAFVITQVAVSLVLVVTGGLFVRSLVHAAKIDPGFGQSRIEVISLDLSLGGYNEETGGLFIHSLQDRIRALRNVDAVTVAADLPLDGSRMGLGGVTVPGVPPPAGEDSWLADANVVEPGFFQVLRLPILRGRDFAKSDTSTSGPVVIVNQAMASRIWPDQDPLGKQIQLAASPDGKDRRDMTVIGVASDARLMSLNEPAEPYFYVPFTQYYLPRTSFLVRLRNDESAIPQIRELVRQMNPNLPLTDALPLSSITALELIPQRIAATTAVSVGALGMLLASIGIYGVTAYAVSRRRREIAIRIALGANNVRVVRFVLQHTMVLTLWGVAVGLTVAAAGSQALKGFLFGIPGLDPLTFLATLAVFGAIAILACFVPVRRATAVDPMIVLRSE